MDKLVTCVSATILEKHNKFTLNNLMKMEANILYRPIPILNMFDHTDVVGRIRSSIIFRDKLIVTCIIYEKSNIYDYIESGFIVPGYRCEGVDIELLCMGFVFTPTDINVTKCKVICYG